MAADQSAKKLALDLIERLPAKATWSDIMDEMYVQTKISTGLRRAREEGTVSLDDARIRGLRLIRGRKKR